MKYIVTILTAVLSWSSCSYDVRVVSVNSPILQNDTLLKHENDTFSIVYNLFDENGLLSFSIYNKSNSPLYVDWKRSAFISGTQKYDYWSDNASMYFVTTGRNLQWLRFYSAVEYENFGVISKPEQITFIPPNTAVSMARFRIANNLIDTGLKERQVDKSYKAGTTFIKVKNYVEANSPLKFRNFLTLSLKHDFSKEFYVDHHFWVDEISQMSNKQFNGPLRVAGYDAAGYAWREYSYPFSTPASFYIKVVEVE